MNYFRTIIHYLCVLALFFISATASAQSTSGNDLFSKIETYNRTLPAEKIFLQTDKPYYSATDTIWFKAYVINGTTNAYSALSGLMYIELINDKSVTVARISVPVKIGLSWGQLPLDEKTFEGGNYTLRAYTNWMKNFGEEAFFTKQLYITNNQTQGWLINQKQNLATINGKQNVTLDIHLKDRNNQSYGAKKVGWVVQDGDNIVTRGGAETDANGGIKVSFNLPEKQKDRLKIIIEDKDGARQAVVPVFWSQYNNIDLQFMPEGGHLIAGIRTQVGFKAIAESGLGIDVEGKIVDSKNSMVMPFKSAYKGMGAFNFVPISGETYKALITTSNGSVKVFDLPQVKPSGVNLRVINNNSSDSISISVNFSQDLVNGQQYQFAGLVNGVVYDRANFAATKSRVNLVLAKNTVPSGIVHFTVFNNTSQPVCERAAFINNLDNLNIRITTSKSTYSTRDSVALKIGVADKSNKPMPVASLSVAVTDDSQVKTDRYENNIISDIFLTSGLKGFIETPAYYFSDTKEAADNLDLLLLTQGWVGYNWESIFKPQLPLFKPEPGFALTGNVTSFDGKPLPASKVTLLMGEKVKLIADTLTDANGRFIFKQLPKFDVASFFVQTQNAKGKKGNMAVSIDEFEPAPLRIKPAVTTQPWYVNTDSEVLNFINNDVALNKQRGLLTGNNVLNEVFITEKKSVKNSMNLNGAGQADQIIDETQVAGAGEISLLDFITKNVKGLYLKVTKNGDHQFAINGRKVNFVVDGLDIRRVFYTADISIIPNVSYNDLAIEMNNLKIKDVIGIEVMNSSNKVLAYDNRLNETTPSLNPDTNAYIEITTRSGNGLITKLKQSIASYQPIPISWPMDFYQPRYIAGAIKKTDDDLRSTIFWQPHLPVPESGQAFTPFYTADKPGTYTVIVQGTNLQGLYGYTRIKINIK
jgi:hypothetical protein